MLRLTAVEGGYGRKQVLRGVDLSVGEGEVVTLMGRNGMGKTTTIQTIMGYLPLTGGQINFDGQDLQGKQPDKVARLGIGLVPEGRHVFPNLTVLENLLATAGNRRADPSPWTLARIYTLFPRLAERARNMGNQLSGGEQQMVAIARALLTNPSLLILDEATEGLAPLVRQEIWQCLSTLKQAGLAILVIDKNVDALVRLADRHYILEKGCVAWQGSSPELLADSTLRRRYLGV